jgi:hypothetical protein
VVHVLRVLGLGSGWRLSLGSSGALSPARAGVSPVRVLLVLLVIADGVRLGQA